jgi:hypothetical protein
VASTGGIVFALTARDLASKAVGKVNNSLGKLGTAGKLAAVGIGFASAATAALGKIALDAVQAAAQDERQAILLNAALKQRGLLTEGLTKQIDEQIIAMGALGISDDQVRAGIEVGSRFFTSRNMLLKANAVAADIAAVTGTDLAEVMTTIGKATQGQTRGLKALGIQVSKNATLEEILTAATEKYGGTAAEIANSTSGKFARSQVRFNETLEELGYRLLPTVNKVMDFLAKEALPAFEAIVRTVGPVLDDLITNYVAPLVRSFGELFAVFEDGDINLLVVALTPLKIFLEALKITVDAIVFGLRTLFAAQGNLGAAGTTSAGYSPYLANAVASGTFVPPMGGGATTNNIFIGTGKVDTVVTDSINRTGTFKRGR